MVYKVPSGGIEFRRVFLQEKTCKKEARVIYNGEMGNANGRSKMFGGA